MKGFTDSLELFKTLIEQIPVATYITPLNFHASSLYNSPQIKQIVGYTAQEWTSNPLLWQECLHQEDRQRVIQALQHSYESYEPFDRTYRMFTREGNEVWVRDQAAVVRDPKGVPRFFLGVVCDVTREKQAENELLAHHADLERLVSERTQALRMSEERYRTLAEASQDMIFIIDKEDCVQYVNQTAIKHFSVEISDILGKPRSNLFPPDVATRQFSILRKVHESGEPQYSESLIPFFGEQPLWISTWLVPLRDEEGEIVSILGVSRDITRQKQTENNLAERAVELARANTLLSTLSAVSTHLGTTNSQAELMEIAGTELKKLGLKIQLLLAEQDNARLVISYTNLDPKALKLAETYTGVPIMGYELHKESTILGKMILEGKACLVEKPLPILLDSFPFLTEEDFRTALPGMEMNPDGPALLLPLKSKDQAIGAIVIWGEDLKEADLTSFALFSSHLAVALDNVRLYNEIHQLALRDDLTGLYNRRGFFTLTEQQLRLAKRKKRDLLLIFMDVDDFKIINDSFGHAEGDRALGEVAKLLKQSFRASDIIARMSGDEFGILAIDTTTEDATSLLERLKINLDNFNATQNLPYQICISHGISVWSPESPLTIDELLSRADAAMYQHKRSK